MRLPGPLTDDQEKQLQVIKRSSYHLLALINDLLDLARIDSGKVKLSAEPVDFRAVLFDVMSSLRPVFDAKKIETRVAFNTEIKTIRSDHRSLHQILLNLIGNAVKFTESGSVEIVCEDVQDSMVFRVADTGIGIAEDQHAKLFEAFSQVRSPESPEQEGSGLGLHLSRKLSHLLGGDITLSSKPGVGSTFTLTIPVTS
jgi:protein-histidine pros-kinase